MPTGCLGAHWISEMNDLEILDVQFSFSKRPVNLPGDLRPNWRVPLLLLMLRYCGRGGKSSLYKLHLLNWSLRDVQSQIALLESLGGESDYSEIRVQVEPSFVQAIQFAVAEGLVDRIKGSKVQLTDGGKQLADDISGTNCLSEEKTFLTAIGNRLTEKWVQAFAHWSRKA